MRILHVSDLHIGHHKPDLLESLKTNVRTIRPDLILATGDFADQPQQSLLRQARTYLGELEALCPSTGGQPKLIAIPGNHDFSLFGNIPVFQAYANYRGVFGSAATHHFFVQDGLWIYGFNSARHRGKAWANGDVPGKDLADFASEYARLKAGFGARFDNAFKIVALHHHPLPIRYSSKYSRWLALLNAGEFLEEMVKKEIDLIVHGHEHVHAKATFGKRVNGVDKKVTVVSVGTLFDREPGNDYNRFNVIHVEPSGEVRIDSHEARGAIFDAEPTDQFAVRTLAEAVETRFEQAAKEKGYEYARVDVCTRLNADGDAFRFVEFRGLDLRDEASDRASGHSIVLPETSGYIDLPSAREIDRSPSNRLGSQSRPLLGGKSAEVTINYGVRLQRGNSISVRCQWWAVNAMAMSRSQFDRKYPDNSYAELTHFPIVDPIEELAWVVTFPSGFVLDGVEPYVARMVPSGASYIYTRYAALEDKLRDAIDFDRDNKRVYLRVRRPLIGHTYGIRWAVPDDVQPQVFHGQTAQIVDRLVEFHGQQSPDPATKEGLSRFLVSLAEFVHDTLAEKSPSPIEVSLMVFDGSGRRMVTPASVKLDGALGAWVDRRSFVFEYGEGLGGRAFKTREIRLYTDQPGGNSPDYYRRVPGAPPHAILLSIPIHQPNVDQDVYAVLNCGSPNKANPLGKLGVGGSTIPAERLGNVREAINHICYKELSDMFVNRP